MTATMESATLRVAGEDCCFNCLQDVYAMDHELEDLVRWVRVIIGGKRAAGM
jgi:hypothetical protein